LRYNAGKMSRVDTRPFTPVSLQPGESPAPSYAVPDILLPHEVRLEEETLEGMRNSGFGPEEQERAIEDYLLARHLLETAHFSQLVVDFARGHFDGFHNNEALLKVTHDCQFYPAVDPRQKQVLSVLTKADMCFSVGQHSFRVSAGMVNTSHVWGFVGRKKGEVPHSDREVIGEVAPEAEALPHPITRGMLLQATTISEARECAWSALTKTFTAIPRLVYGIAYTDFREAPAAT